MSQLTIDQLLDDLKQHLFLFVSNINVDKEDSYRLVEAYNRLESFNISIRWCRESEPIPSHRTSLPVVYVLNSLDTPFFHEIKDNFRVLTPICLLTCLQQFVKIPISSVRCLYNLALRHCHVTTSCFPNADTHYLKSRIVQMGGLYSPKLFNTITHLITEEVHSTKYSVANEHKIPVVLRSWLDEAWELGMSNPSFSARDLSFTAKHKCPIFMKCNVTITSYKGPERCEIQRLLIENGANFTSILNPISENPTTHLIAKMPGSEKYKNAPASRVIIVTKKWLTDSIDRGYRLPEENYHPEKNHDNTPSVQSSSNSRFSKPQLEQMNNLIDNLDLNQGSTHSYLDGCNIFLCGFNDYQISRIKKLINMCNGTRFNILNSSVTHVVCGNLDHKEVDEICQFSPPPTFILTYFWIIECWEHQKIVPENKFIIRFGEMGMNHSRGHRLIKKSRRNSVQFDNTDSGLIAQYVKEEKILANLNFHLIDPDVSMIDSIRQMILTNGGNLITGCSVDIPQYIIVPVNFKQRLEFTTHLVTLFWLEESIFYKKLLPHDQHPLYCPAQDFFCQDVLSGLTVTLLLGDKYVELSCYIQLLNYMGAIHSVHLKKSGNDRTDVVITNNLDHEAVKRAQLWGIPIVSKEWGLECALNREKIPFEKFVITNLFNSNKDLAPHFPNIMASPEQSKLDSLDARFELEEAHSYFPTNRIIPHQFKMCKSTNEGNMNNQLEELYLRNMDDIFKSVSTASDVNFHRRGSIRPILQGYKLNFDKCFTQQELEQMANMVIELGGSHSFSDASSITHYIYKCSNESDWSEEANNFQKMDIPIVHPQWLFHMKKSQMFIDVIYYPPSFCTNAKICYFQTKKENIHSDGIQNSPQLVIKPSRISIDSGIPMLDNNQSRGKNKIRTKRLRSPESSAIENLSSADYQANKVYSADLTCDVYKQRIIHSPLLLLNSISTQEIFENFSLLCRESEEERNSPLEISPDNNNSITFKKSNGNTLPRESRLRKKKSYIGWAPKPEAEDKCTTKNYLSTLECSAKKNSSTVEISTTFSNSISSMTPSQNRQLTVKSSLNSSNVNDILQCSQNNHMSSQLSKYTFMFSSIDNKAKSLMKTIILKLGGKILDSPSYNNSCTHLICGNFKLHEKVVCSMAAGVFIISPEFIDASNEEGRFICEDPFEWGNPLNSMKSEGKYKIHVVHKWRKKIEKRIQDMSQNGSLYRRNFRPGAFDGWLIFYLCKNCKNKNCKFEIYRRIILAGGGKMTTNLSKDGEITIALTDTECISIKSKSILAQLKECDIPVLKFNYVLQYLENFGESIEMDDFALNFPNNEE